MEEMSMQISTVQYRIGLSEPDVSVASCIHQALIAARLSLQFWMCL